MIDGKNVLITGGALRVGKAMAMDVARNRGTVILHYHTSEEEALATQAEIEQNGGTAHLIQGNLNNVANTSQIIEKALTHGPLFALVNSASVFKNIGFAETTLEDWEFHLRINLTSPFLLSKTFSESVDSKSDGRIVNILDWRALRPNADHFPYTISKAGLAAMTRSLAVALAPNITVNGIAFGAILPPSDGGDTSGILDDVPAGRWAELDEVCRTLMFLLHGPNYITGDIIYLDGGRHLI